MEGNDEQQEEEREATVESESMDVTPEPKEARRPDMTPEPVRRGCQSPDNYDTCPMVDELAYQATPQKKPDNRHIQYIMHTGICSVKSAETDSVYCTSKRHSQQQT